MKKIFIFILITVLFSTITQNCFAYTAGEVTVDVDLGAYTQIVNAAIADNSLEVDAGGKVSYQLYIPFNAVSINLFYTISTNITINVYIDGKKYDIPISGSEKFFSLGDVIRRGEHSVTIMSSNKLKLHGITFVKEDVDVCTAASPLTVPALTEFEKSIQTAIIINTNSSVIMVNGSKRYVNNDNPKEKPYVFDNEVYLPIHSFGRAFGYYYEEKGEEIVLTKEDKSFYLKNNSLWKKMSESEPVQIDNIIIRHENGEYYIPIEYFARLDGKTVVRRNDFYIIEYSSNAKKIINDTTFSQLQELYTPLYCNEAIGRTYYVGQCCKADDNNDGSYEYPFKTIKKASDVAVAGDTVIIRSGVYHEVINPKNDGTASQPITFRAEEGADVEISAAASLGTPLKSGDMLVYDAIADLGEGRNQIFYKGENLIEARHPNTHTSDRPLPKVEPYSSLWATQGNIRVAEEDKMIAVSDTDLNQETDFWKGGTFVALTGAGWSLGSAKIQSSEPGILNLSDATDTWWFASKGAKYSDFGYITGCVNAIDKAGEWAYDNGKIYILPPEGETADTLRLEQKIRQLAIDIADRKYIRIEGINTYGGGIKMNDSEMCMLRNGEYKYISHYTYTMDQREGFIDSRDIHNSDGAPPRGEMGIYLGGENNIIIDNHIAYSAASGIYSVGKYEYIENNIISDCGYMGSYVGGIFVATNAWDKPDTPRGGNAIFSNSVYNSGRYVYGICTTESWYLKDEPKVLPAFLPDEVAYNDFYNGALSSRDVGTVYMHGAVIGTDRKKSQFHNNLVFDSWSFDSFNSGIYYDNWMNGGECYDNVVFYSDERIAPRNYVYTQLKSMYPTSFATINQWNNINAGLISGGKDKLSVEDYPNEKRFSTGAAKLAKELTPMLNDLGLDNEWYTPKDMTYSSGVKIINGNVSPSTDGDWICIPNVDFSGEKNRIDIEFSGDVYNTSDKVSIIVGNSVNDYEKFTDVVLKADSPYLWGTNKVGGFIHGITGIKNVFIKFNSYKSAAVRRVKMTNGVDPYKTSANIFASDGSVYNSTGSGSNETGFGGYTAEDQEHQYYKNTWEGTVLKYENINVSEDSETLLIKAASGGSYTGQNIKITINDVKGDVIGSYVVDATEWTDFNMRSVPLEQKLKAGTYTFYVQFVTSGTTNFYYFGFK